MPQTPKIIYIAGSGRSGSTMLSLLLSQHPQISNFGQIRDVFFARSNAASCSCGASLDRCRRWGPVLASAPHETRRLGYLPEAVVLALYKVAFKTWGTDIAVDSSKSIELCRVLGAADEFEFFCLHLIRDPRAVAVSWSKVLHNPDLLRKRCRNWVGRQKRIEQEGRKLGRRFLQIRYEDLTHDPQAAVCRIQDWVGLSTDLTAFDGARTAHISWKDQHLFAPANKDVLKARAAHITISEATAWRRKEYKPLRTLATELCFPFAERYGYRLRAAA